MFVYPQQSLVGRIMPKNMIYQNIRVSTAIKNQFVSQVKEIVWKYKLSENKINLSPKEGVAEIQVFEITLKTPDLSQNVLKIIDKAIALSHILPSLLSGKHQLYCCLQASVRK